MSALQYSNNILNLPISFPVPHWVVKHHHFFKKNELLFYAVVTLSNIFMLDVSKKPQQNQTEILYLLIIISLRATTPIQFCLCPWWMVEYISRVWCDSLSVEIRTFVQTNRDRIA